MASIKGGCLCGAVTYEITGEPMFVGHCACQNCQKSYGAGHGTIAAFAEPSFACTGKLATYDAKTDSGQPATYHFCPTCGSRVFTRAAAMPGVVMVTLGTMDADADLTPQMLIYGKRRRAWDWVDPSVPVFEGMPTPPS